MRIFVGGLAESVGAADLEALFASAGRVAGVEFVRVGRTNLLGSMASRCH